MKKIKTVSSIIFLTAPVFNKNDAVLFQKNNFFLDV
jgi:hypothetical protein